MLDFSPLSWDLTNVVLFFCLCFYYFVILMRTFLFHMFYWISCTVWQIKVLAASKSGKKEEPKPEPIEKEKPKPDALGKAARDVAQSVAADAKKEKTKPVYFERLGDVSFILLDLQNLYFWFLWFSLWTFFFIFSIHFWVAAHPVPSLDS